MKLAKRTILGLTIDDRGIACAQVSLAGRRPVAQRLGRFAPDGGVSLDRAAAVGAELGAFLKGHGFNATSAVVGVPARWVLAQDRELPPTDAAAAVAMLRLQAERLAVEEMSFDVAGRLEGSETRRAMLVGILRRQLDRLTALCTAAGLALEGVTPTTLAVARLVPADGRPLVVVGDGAAEYVGRDGRVPTMLKHLTGESGGAGPAVAAVGAELRRTLMLRAGGAADGFQLWSDGGWGEQQFRDIAERAGAEPRRVRPVVTATADVVPQALNGDAGRSDPESYLPAIAVAMTAADDADGPAVNLVRPRLIEPPVNRVNRTTLLVVTAAAAVVAGLASLYMTTTQREAEAVRLAAEYKALEPEAKAAKAGLQRFSYGRAYFEQRSGALAALREVSAAFGNDSAIWSTGFTLRENGKGTLQGRASSQQPVFKLRDALQANAKFADVQLQDVREGTGASRDVAFTLSFTFTGGN